MARAVAANPNTETGATERCVCRLSVQHVDTCLNALILSGFSAGGPSQIVAGGQKPRYWA
jgi:hypothetical protein